MLITDILHAFAQNPTDPAYDPNWQMPRAAQGPRGFVEVPSGIHKIGHDGGSASASTTSCRATTN